MSDKNFVLKGHICYSEELKSIEIFENSYLVCEDGKSAGVFKNLPNRYEAYPLTDYYDKLIIPGLIDLHTHAPQYSFRALGMDMELLDWLDKNAFTEEAKYAELEYARKAYSIFAENIKTGATTRICIFATLHRAATKLLMDIMEETGLIARIGKVNMDRNAPDKLREISAEKSAEETISWIEETLDRYKNVSPILTPRFIPSCSDKLMGLLGNIQIKYGLPLQSHLSESLGEINWVRELCPQADFYGDAYDKFGLFGGDCKTIMAHCVSSDARERARIKEKGVYVAHCPQSNTNLASGIAPVRKFLDEGINLGLGSDVAGGFTESIFRAMTDTIQMSKLYWRLIDKNDKPLTIDEAFYLGTKGGGSFFGKTGSFETGFEFDAIILDDYTIKHPQPLTVRERLERAVYLSDDRHIAGKYVAGNKLF